MSDEMRKVDETDEDERLEVTALVVLGVIFPLAGFAWGPGSWWVYLIWLAIGAAAVGLYGYSKGWHREDGQTAVKP